jgi:hypothetical protein
LGVVASKTYLLSGKMGWRVGAWKYKVAIGGELIMDFGHEEKGIGSGSDQIGALELARVLIIKKHLLFAIYKIVIATTFL